MNQRTFVIIFIIITVVGVGIVAYSRFSSNNNLTPSASPSPDANLFNQQQTSSMQPNQNIKQYPKFPGDLSPDELKDKKAVLETNKGIIEFEIYPEASSAASNFIFLAFTSVSIVLISFLNFSKFLVLPKRLPSNKPKAPPDRAYLDLTSLPFFVIMVILCSLGTFFSSPSEK